MSQIKLNVYNLMMCFVFSFLFFSQLKAETYSVYVAVNKEDRCELLSVDSEDLTSQTLAVFGFLSKIAAFLPDPDKNELYLAFVNPNKIYKVDLSNNTIIDSIAVNIIGESGRIFKRVSDDFLYSVVADSSAIITIDFAAKTTTRETIVAPAFWDARPIKHGEFLILLGEQISLYDMTQKRIVTSFVYNRKIWDVAWSEKRELLYSVSDHDLTILDLFQPEKAETFLGITEDDSNYLLRHLRFNDCEEQLFIGIQGMSTVFNAIKKNIANLNNFPSGLGFARNSRFLPDQNTIFYITGPRISIEGLSEPIPGKLVKLSLVGAPHSIGEIGFRPLALEVVSEPTSMKGDFDGDGNIGLSDFLLFIDAFGGTNLHVNWDCQFDLSGNGSVNFQDFLFWIEIYAGKEGGMR